MPNPDPNLKPVATKWRTGANRFQADGVTPLGVGVDVDVRVIEGGKGLYKEVWRQDGNTTTIICDIAWKDRDLFLTQMIGRSYRAITKVGADPETVSITRVRPEYNPLKPSQYCVHCELIDEYGNARQNSGVGPYWPEYDRAVYMCVFQGVPYRPLYDDNDPQWVNGSGYEGSRFTYWRRRWITREQKIPGGGLKIAEGANKGLPLGEVGMRPSSEVEYQCTWYQIPVNAIPVDSIEACAAKVNNANFFVDGKLRPAETVLFKGADEKKYFTAAGDYVADLTYLFGVRAEGWNKFPDRTGEMVRVTTDGDPASAGLYKTTTLTNLFKPERSQD